MKTNFLNQLILVLLFLIIAPGQIKSQIHYIYNDNMESYTTATTTSIGLNPPTSNPVNWRFQAYQGRVTPATFEHNPASITGSTTAGMDTEPGNRFARLQTTFASVPNNRDYWGTQIWMAPNTAAVTTATTYASYFYSIRIRVNTPMGFYLQFNSLDSSGNLNGTYRKWFNITTPNQWITLSGNLAEPGWAANPTVLSATPMLINNNWGYQMFIELNELNGNPKSANLVLHFDDVQFWVPEPGTVALVGLGVLLLGTVIIRSRVKRRQLPLDGTPS